jgi:hypothetical protein
VQEAYVMQRIAELQREGLWSEKRLPKVQEPPRVKAHWDYLIEEMIWLAADFAQERKWKKAAAKKVSFFVFCIFVTVTLWCRVLHGKVIVAWLAKKLSPYCGTYFNKNPMLDIFCLVDSPRLHVLTGQVFLVSRVCHLINPLKTKRISFI